MLLVYLPQGGGSSTTVQNGKLYLGTKIVDYSYNYNFNGTFRIQSLASKDSLVQFNQQVPVYSSVRNNSGPVTYNWYINGTLVTSNSDSTFVWSVPSTAGEYKLLLNAIDSVGSSSKDSLYFAVVAHIPVPPVINGFTMDSAWYYVGNTATITCHAISPNGGTLKYMWGVPGGTIISQQDSVLKWTVPSADGLYTIACTVKNADSLTANAQQLVLVKKMTQYVNGPIAYYPLNDDVKDYSGNGHNATASGITPTTDARGESNMAFQFNGNGIIDVPNDASLNFQNQITLSFWVKLNSLPAESYVLSHGSYQQRWKISVIPDGDIRWTVKTATSTTDLDSSFPLQLNTFYHFTMVYTGYSMEIYANGVLDSYSANMGLMATATDDITFGQETSSVTGYGLYGTLDEVRIYGEALGPNEIITLKTLWYTGTTGPVTGIQGEPEGLTIYPNPSTGVVNVKGINEPVTNVSLVDMTGRSINTNYSFPESDDLLHVEFSAGSTGILILKIETATSVIYKKIVCTQ
jgi:hypothetical protein